MSRRTPRCAPNRLLKKAQNRLLTRAARTRAHVYACIYGAATVRERWTRRDGTSRTLCMPTSTLCVRSEDDQGDLSPGSRDRGGPKSEMATRRPSGCRWPPETSPRNIVGNSEVPKNRNILAIPMEWLKLPPLNRRHC